MMQTKQYAILEFLTWTFAATKFTCQRVRQERATAKFALGVMKEIIKILFTPSKDGHEKSCFPHSKLRSMTIDHEAKGPVSLAESVSDSLQTINDDSLLALKNNAPELSSPTKNPVSLLYEMIKFVPTSEEPLYIL